MPLPRREQSTWPAMVFRTAEEALQFFAAGEWAFTRSLNYRRGGGVGTVVGRARWKPWPHAVAAGSVTSVDSVPLPAREHLLLYDEVRPHARCGSAATRMVGLIGCAPAGQEGQLQLQGVQQPLRVTRQYAFNCAQLPVTVFFIGGELGSGGSSVALGEAPSVSCKTTHPPAIRARLFVRPTHSNRTAHLLLGRGGRCQTCSTLWTLRLLMKAPGLHSPRHSATHASMICESFALRLVCDLLQRPALYPGCTNTSGSGGRPAVRGCAISCSRFRYEGSLVVNSAVEFGWSWRVTGPEKDGTIHTR
jgi:hypothetical protein